jgi:flagellar motor switch protein FliG
MDLKLTLQKDLITKDIARRIALLDQVPKQAYDYFKSITPIRSGNARRKTYLNNDTIQAAYPYAEKLDKGYSKQATSGMSNPTKIIVKRIVDRIIRKK